MRSGNAEAVFWGSKAAHYEASCGVADGAVVHLALGHVQRQVEVVVAGDAVVHRYAAALERDLRPAHAGAHMFSMQTAVQLCMCTTLEPMTSTQIVWPHMQRTPAMPPALVCACQRTPGMLAATACRYRGGTPLGWLRWQEPAPGTAVECLCQAQEGGGGGRTGRQRARAECGCCQARATGSQT